MKKESLVNLFFLAVIIIAFYLFYRIFSPFFSILAWAFIITIILYPLYRILHTRLGRKNNLAATVMTIVVIFMMMLPSAFFLNLLAKEVVDVYNYCEQFIRQGKHEILLESLQDMPAVWDALGRVIDVSQLDLSSLVLNNLRKFSIYVAGQTTKVIRGFTTVLFQFFLMSVALFFLFRDGDRLLQRVKDLMPFSARERDTILKRIVEMIQATIHGGLVVALVQGSLGGLGFAVVGLPAPILWAAVMAFLSFVPVVGAWIVWIPASVILFVQHAYLKGIILSAWGVILISFSDNFIRPVIISEKTQIHTLLLFFGILGGIKAFGFLGFMAGPIIVTICLAFIEIYTSRTDERSSFSG